MALFSVIPDRFPFIRCADASPETIMFIRPGQVSPDEALAGGWRAEKIEANVGWFARRVLNPAADKGFCAGKRPRESRRRSCRNQLAGMVTRGRPSLPPVSVKDIRIIRNVKVRFDGKSPSSIQYQVPRYSADVKAFSGFSLP